MKETNATNLLLAMSAPPYWHCGRTVAKRSIDYLIALAPAILFALINWGMPAARVICLSVAVCVLTEAACCALMKRRNSVDDLTAIVTGILFAFMLPAASPWWLVVLGAMCCMLFGKMLFGGLGDNPVSTPIVGWAILFVSFPTYVDANIMQLSTTWVDPLARLKYFGVEAANAIPLTDLLLGQQIAPLGAGQVGALIVGGLYLVLRGGIRWQIPLGVFLGVFIPFAFVQITNDQSVSCFFHLGTGSIVLCAFFLATEPNIAPTHSAAMVLYGITCGLMIFIIRTFGSYSDGAPFAVLVTCLLTPYFDLIRPKPFGVR